MARRRRPRRRPLTTVPPLVALVGRPNVGKSTLFNRMIGARKALVTNRPGVTRDRMFGECAHEGYLMRVVDTGGLDDDKDDPLLKEMLVQTQLAIDEADVVVLVLDGAGGLLPADREVATRLRRSGVTTVAAVNKADVVAHDERALEFYELGFDVLNISAEHGRHFGELLDYVFAKVDAPKLPDDDDEFPELGEAVPDEDGMEEGLLGRGEHVPDDNDTSDINEDDTYDADAATRTARPKRGAVQNEGPLVPETTCLWPGGPIRVAVIGRPNVGKSSFVNHMLGEERMVSSPVAGTTRDSVDSLVKTEEGEFILVDTAGIRRRKSIADRLEKFSVMAALRTVDRADVVVMVLDATERPSEQDLRVVTVAHDRGKGIIILGNKWDLIENPEWRDGYPKAIEMDLAVVGYAPFFRVSAKTGRGMHRVLGAIVAAQKQRYSRVSTSVLNRFVDEALIRQPLNYYKGKRAQIFYASQPMVAPPTFVFASRNADHISGAYRRYLSNKLRERFGFEATPLWLKFRDRER